MNVGIIGTGAIANLHARVYRRIGFSVIVCTDVIADAARRFAAANGCEVSRPGYEDVCRHPAVDYVDVCTLPDFRLEPIGGMRGVTQTCPSAEADGDDAGDGAADDRHREAAQDHAGRRQPASVRRVEPVPEIGARRAGGSAGRSSSTRT